MTIKNKLVLLSFFSNQNLYIPIKVLFFVKYMATYSEISAFKFFFVFAMLFLEIPSGLLSDKIGNKKIVVAGRTFLIFALLLIILSKNIMGFYVASTLLGISASLESGSLNSYQIGLGDKYNFNFSNLMVKIAKYNTIISVLFTITSSFLYAVSSELPFIITILLLLATWLMIVFGLPSYEKERRKKEEFFSK
ncbi:MAG: hypothetical protein LBS33_04020, partial [Streptococcaceae bacterium]|nr:hypothetical protein [Streptococcaceae bacterium]